MSFSHTFERSVTTAGKKTSASFAVTHDNEIGIDLNVNDAVVDQLVELVFTIARLKSIFIKSDKDVTLEFNSIAGSGGIIALKANKPYEWIAAAEGGYFTNLITANVTALYISNASGAAARVELSAIVDPTP
jgi:hypothetical protein